MRHISKRLILSVFRANDSPRYIKAFIAHIVLYGVQLVAIIFLRIHLMHRNVLKRRAQGMTLDDDHAKANGENPVSLIDFFLLAYWDMKSDLRTYRKDENLGHKHAFDDLTDKENPDCEWMYCFHWFGPDVQLVF